MTPVNQRITHKPELGQHGDCKRATVASMLNLTYEEVPHFAQIANGDVLLFWDTVDEFIESKGYLTEFRSWHAIDWSSHENTFHEISGKSPRGDFNHAVIGLNGQMVFDPHPSRAGIAGNSDDWIVTFYRKV